MKAEFNQKVLAMREAKKKVIDSICSNNKLVQEIDSEVFGEDVPKHLDDEVSWLVGWLVGCCCCCCYGKKCACSNNDNDKSGLYKLHCLTLVENEREK